MVKTNENIMSSIRFEKNIIKTADKIKTMIKQENNKKTNYYKLSIPFLSLSVGYYYY